MFDSESKLPVPAVFFSTQDVWARAFSANLLYTSRPSGRDRRYLYLRIASILFVTSIVLTVALHFFLQLSSGRLQSRVSSVSDILSVGFFLIDLTAYYLMSYSISLLSRTKLLVFLLSMPVFVIVVLQIPLTILGLNVPLPPVMFIEPFQSLPLVFFVFYTLIAITLTGGRSWVMPVAALIIYAGAITAVSGNYILLPALSIRHLVNVSSSIHGMLQLVTVLVATVVTTFLLVFSMVRQGRPRAPPGRAVHHDRYGVSMQNIQLE